jgi:hypothetical protein
MEREQRRQRGDAVRDRELPPRALQERGRDEKAYGGGDERANAPRAGAECHRQQGDAEDQQRGVLERPHRGERA